MVPGGGHPLGQPGRGARLLPRATGRVRRVTRWMHRVTGGIRRVTGWMRGVIASATCGCSLCHPRLQARAFYKSVANLLVVEKEADYDMSQVEKETVLIDDPFRVVTALWEEAPSPVISRHLAPPRATRTTPRATPRHPRRHPAPPRATSRHLSPPSSTFHHRRPASRTTATRARGPTGGSASRASCTGLSTAACTRVR